MSSRRREQIRRVNARLWQEKPFCHWCCRPLQKEQATVDHLIRRADGGCRNSGNIVIACFLCNSLRGMCDDPEKISAHTSAILRGERPKLDLDTYERWHGNVSEEEQWDRLVARYTQWSPSC